MQERNFEQEARAQGWKPQEEYSGENWVDARTFVERGEKYIGIMKSRYDALARDVAYQKQLNEDFKAHMARVEENHKRELEATVKRLEAEREKAITTGDGAAFNRADQALQKARTAAAQPVKTAQPPQPDPQWAVEWKNQNEWYGLDTTATAVAEAYAQQLAVANPQLQGKAFLDKITEHVKAELPDRFVNKNKDKQPPVESNVQHGVPQTDSSDISYAALPKEAKAEFNRLAREGIFKNTDEGKQRFAALYNS